MLDIDKYKPEAVVIGNGEPPSQALMEKWLQNKPYTVCCDGATNFFVTTHYPIHHIIGDGDSLAPEIALQYANILERSDEQETNDQTKAVLHLQKKGINRIVILGATGRREDHTIGNISLLIYYLKRGIQALIVSENGVFVPCKDDTLIKTRVQQQVSIFRYDATSLSADNLLYPLRDFDMLWQGTLNQATANYIRIKANGYYLVFLAN